MPAGKTRKNPNYEADSKVFAEECLAARKKWQAEAAKVISLKLKRAAEKIVSLVDLPEEISEEQAKSANISLKAASHLLKLGGLEVDQYQHSGTISFEPVTFEREGDSGK